MHEHRTPWPRAYRVGLLLATSVSLLVLSLGASASASPVSHKHAKAQRGGKARKASVPASGIYDACAYSDPKPTPLPNCDDRLTTLRQGGFRVVLNYWSTSMSIEENLRYADKAASLGMRVIWNLANYQSMSLGPKLDLVRATASHPATWGYYIGDEVEPVDRGKVAELSRAVRSLTRLPTLYVSRPNPAKLRPFKRLANYVGPDNYSVGPIDPPTCRTSRWASKMVKAKLTIVLQAYSWSIDFVDLEPNWPTAGQMRRMRDQATRCGRPTLLMWFCFHCITDYNPDPEAYWRQVAWAANGVSLGPNYRMAR